MTETLIGLAIWGLSIVAGYYLGRAKNRAGWAMALVLGPLGVLLVAVLPKAAPAPEVLGRDRKGHTVTPGFERAHDIDDPGADS
jgi:hypothetical protein